MTNLYLTGNFAPVDRERTDFDLPVTGRIPESLDGRYLRNGPNPVRPPDPSTYHWFTGDGMVHGIRLRDGRAEWYRNRWIRAGAVPTALGEPDPGGPGTPGADFAANTNIVQIGGRTFALVEAGAKPVELSDRLETLGRSDFGGKLTYGYTAHPKIDPVTGEIHAANYFWGNQKVIQYVVLDSTGQVTHCEDVRTPGNTMVHDVSITQNFVILYDQCVTFDLESASRGSALPYTWNPDYGCRVGLLTRDRSNLEPPKWFEVQSGFVFHAMNSFESTNDAGEATVVLDVILHERGFDSNPLAPDESKPSLWRREFNLATGSVTEHRLGDTTSEFPRVDERLTGLPYSFGYSVTLEVQNTDDGLSFGGSQLNRHDTVTGTVETHDLKGRWAAGEMTFVPASPDAPEGDGYLLTFVYDTTTDRSELWILAAQDISAEPLARVHLPTRIPFGFHGNWVQS